MDPIAPSPASVPLSTRIVDFLGIVLIAILVSVLYALAMLAFTPRSGEQDPTASVVTVAAAFGVVAGHALALLATVGSRAPYCPRRALRGMLISAASTGVLTLIVQALGGDIWLASAWAGSISGAFLGRTVWRERGRFVCAG